MKKLLFLMCLMVLIISSSLATSVYYPSAIALNEETGECGVWGEINRNPENYELPDKWVGYVAKYEPYAKKEVLTTPRGYCEFGELIVLGENNQIISFHEICCESLGFTYIGNVGELKQVVTITNYLSIVDGILIIVLPVYLSIPIIVFFISSIVIGKIKKDNFFAYLNKKGLIIGSIIGIILSVITFFMISLPYSMGGPSMLGTVLLLAAPILFYSFLGSSLGYLIKRFKS